MKYSSAHYVLSCLAATSVALSLPTLPIRNSGINSTPSIVSSAPTGAATSTVGFAADQSINVNGIYAAAHASHTKVLASYPGNSDRKTVSTIYGDWQNLPGVSAFHFIADMDTDCDGLDSNCKGNKDGQSETSFGALDATKVPYFVLPERFTEQNKAILQANALGAIICDGKMFYGIYGDQNADSPEVIGEASILVGQTCFPNTNIDGENGHAEDDVAYIVFGSVVPPGIQKNTIDIPALKALGDEQMKLLQTALGL
ncbi:fungal chitosanase of glycosyl hydrolase group 75-domain-containing protein [Mycena maculata]|uniref:Endo-chitosanase n=1 Tax=Mycena maculata TaxID=230809 RepID=A0AAD7JSC6_9AGAR|nr:fungal chitosanase of glycosyl hydrolase group 75-domain-containing protein [Mycena maculata]